MGQKLDIKNGDRFGNLEVVSEADRYILPSGQKNRAFLCRCDCGETKVIRLLHLIRGRIKSCGCVNPLHGWANTKLYNTWRAMKNRMLKSHINSDRYYYRGIRMKSEWDKFVAFKKWALSNGWEDGLTIDRIDNSKGYYPSNCRFVTPTENSRNRDVTIKILYNNSTMPLMSVLEDKGIVDRYYLVLGRIKRGWDHQLAVDKPARKGNYNRNEV